MAEVVASNLDDLLTVLTTDFEVITEFVADMDLRRLNSAQTQDVRSHVTAALEELSKLEDCLRGLGE